jgi:hypothetical protein
MKLNEIKHIFIAVLAVTLITCYSVAHPLQNVTEAPVIGPVEVKAQEVTYPPVEEYIRLKFGVYADKAVTMLKTCENKQLNPTAINWNSNGTWDFGLFQVNQVHGYSQEQLSDYKFNTDIAWKIFERAGFQFTDWTCAYAVGETPFYLK